MDQQYPNGTLFQNKNKKDEKHPDYTGSLEVESDVVHELKKQLDAGVSFPKISIAGWKRTAKKSGETFLSVKGSVFQERQNRDGMPRQQSTTDDDFTL